MTEQALERIEKKLDLFYKLFAKLFANRLIEGKSKTDSILILGSLGLDVDLISEIVDTTPATVRARLSEAKKKSQTETKKRIKTERESQ